MALLLAAAIPALMGASTSTAAPQAAASVGASATPNPTPWNGVVTFRWGGSAGICWDNWGNGSEGTDVTFQRQMTQSEWWTVQCTSGARQDTFVDVLPPNPTGWFDHISQGVAEGWTCDASDFNAALQVDFYVDGPFGSGSYAGSTIANITRWDIAGQCGNTPNHAFSFTIPDSLRTGNQRTLYAYALNIGGGSNVLLGNSPRTFTLSRPPTFLQAPHVSPTGPVIVGTQLTTTNGVWTPDPDDFAYQWLRDGQPIAGAVSPTYTVTSADLNRQIRSTVVACKGTACTTPAQSSNAVLVVANPIGWFDAVSAQGFATGWACDPDNFGAALQVDFYVDGPFGSGTFAGATIANVTRSDIAGQCGNNANHAFSFRIPDSLRTGNQRTLYAYALNIGPGSNVLLGNSPRTFTLWRPPTLVQAPQVSPAGPVTIGTQLNTSNGTWNIDPDDFSYQWLRDGQPISGAVSPTYTTTSADLNRQIRSTVVACEGTACTAPTQSSNAVLVVANPVGWFDGIDGFGVATGWACDADNHASALEVRFYVDGPIGTGTLAGSTTANISRNLGSNCGGTSTHGFSFTIPDSLRNGTQRTLYAYGVNIGGGSDALLGNSPRTFTLWRPPTLVQAPQVSPAGSVAIGSQLNTSNGTWNVDPDDFSYQWLRDGQPISGAVSPTYTTTSADLNRQIRSTVVACEGTACSTPVQSSNAVLVVAKPVGWFDQISPQGVATGWTCDEDNFGAALEVRFYVDGPIGTGTQAGTAIANVPRQLGSNCGGTSNHGFSFTIPDSLRTGNQRTLYAYGINIGGGSDALLGNSPRTFTLDRPPQLVQAPHVTPVGPVTPETPLQTTNGTWNVDPDDFGYTWWRDGDLIEGAESQIYEVIDPDIGHHISSRVTACVGIACSTEQPSSNQVEVIELPGPPIVQTYGTGANGCTFIACGGALTQGDPVNSRTGVFTTSVHDLDVPGTGVSFAWTRSYTSANNNSGRLGPGWTDSYAISLAIALDGDVVVHGEGGQQVEFEKEGGSFDGAAGAQSTLFAVAGGYELLRRNQVVYRFDTSGRLLSIKDRHDQGVTLGYGALNRLTTLTDSANRQATLSYNSQGFVSQVQTQDGRSVSYGYTAARLTSVTDVRGKSWTYTYDSGGRLESIVDPLGHAEVTNVYDANGRVDRQTDARGKVADFNWDAQQEVATVVDANQNIWTHDYHEGVLVADIDPITDGTTFARDGELNPTVVTGPTGDLTELEYDEAGNLETVRAVALGGVEKNFDYNARNDVELITDAAGVVTDNVYDAEGNLISVTRDGIEIGSYTHDDAGRVETFTDANGRTWTNTYFPATGYLASSTDPLGNKTTYTYDGAGRVLTKVEPKGNVVGCNCAADFTWTYTYDAAGNQLTERNPLGHTTTNVYDDAGRLTSTTDALGRTTSYTYDNANNVLSETAPDPDGAGPLAAPVTTYTYDDVGNKLTETDPRGNTTRFTYDAANRLVSTTEPDPDGAAPQTAPVTTNVYDENGNLASIVEPRGNVPGANADDFRTTYTYDAAGRMLTEARPDPDGAGPRTAPVTTNAYDEVGNLASVTDANNHDTEYTYDTAGRVLTVEGPDGGLTSYTYDEAGNVLTRTDDNDHTTSFTYDDAGRLVTETSPDPDGPGPKASAVTTYTYDPNGNRVTVTDPNGNATPATGDGVTTYGYDRANRPTSINYSDTTADVTFTLDAVGNRLTMVDGSGSETRTYDNLSRVKTVVRGSNTFSYVYDAASNVTQRTYPGNTIANYTYDPLNRLSSVVSSSQTTRYAYDAASNLTQTTLPSGNGYVETRVYDRAGRVTEVKNQRGSTVLSRFVSTLDPVGNPTQIVRTGGLNQTQAYTYDANDRITSVCFQATCPGASDPFIRWTYDRVGNRLTEQRPTGTTAYVYDARDRLLSAGSTMFGYDANGNQTQKSARTFAYDLANRMRSTTQGSTTTTYLYDGDGKRLQASTGSSSSSKTNFLWDTSLGLPQLVRETNGSGSLLRRYLYGNRRISMTNSSNTTYYHHDPLGSVANMTSSSGSIRWTYSYEPFGTTRTETSNSGPTNFMKFAGEYGDPTSLYHLRARQYDTSTGRFLHRDPVAVPAQRPLFASYVYAKQHADQAR
jgi:RHS repeat-associated protein